MTLRDYFLQSFERFKDRIAFDFPFNRDGSILWRSFTYSHIKDQAFRLASYLQREISASDRVILYADNSPYWCSAYIGIILSGAIAVPVDVETDAETLQNIIKDSEPAIILYSERTAGTVRGLRGFNIEKIEELPPSERIEPVSLSEEDIASIIYTSGTTGRPKAVMLSHGNFVFEIEAVIKTGIISETDNILSLLPLHHTYPFVCTFLIPFSIGAKVTFSPGLKGEEVMRTIRERGITCLVAVPLLLELLHKRIMERFKALPIFIRHIFYLFKSISSFLRRRWDINLGKYLFFFLHRRTGFQFRYFTTGGARLNPEVMKDLEALGFTVIEGYGLTETSPIATFNPVKRRKPGSAGKPLEGVELTILSPDDSGKGGEITVGEIAIRGPLVMKGYYKDRGLTEEAIRDGWLLTGDLGYIDSEGYLFITGRKKDVIVLSSGKTIYPEDVEERYRKAIPLIKEICLLNSMEAVIFPDHEEAKRRGIVNIHSFLKWEIENVSRGLSSHMRIKGFRLVKEPLPKTRLGKFKRYLIGESTGKRAERPEDPHLKTDTGRRLKEIILSFAPEQRDLHSSDHLEIDLGIDSLRRIELASSIEKEFSIKLDDQVIRNWYTLKDILDYIDTYRDRPSQVRQREGGGFYNSFLFKRLKFILLWISHLLLRSLFMTLFRMKIRGLENLPPPPFIIAPNHTSYFDGFVIFSALPFRISGRLYFQGLKRYFPLRFISELLNVIPVSPHTELIDAMERSKECLRRGDPLCIFPEGGRSFDGEIREFKSGFALLSISESVPVVPVIIDGTFRILPRGRIIPRYSSIKVQINPPITPPASLSQAQEFTERVREEMIRLKKALV